MQVDGVFARNHIGDGGTCSAGLFGREFGFRRHICCCGRKIGLEACVRERRPREKVLDIPISEGRWRLGVGVGRRMCSESMNFVVLNYCYVGSLRYVLLLDFRSLCKRTDDQGLKGKTSEYPLPGSTPFRISIGNTL